MAVVSKRKAKGGTRWTCQVRYRGVAVSRTFGLQKAAERWGQDVERAVDALPAGVAFDPLPFTKPEASQEEKRRREALDRNPDTDLVPRADWTLARAIEAYVRDVVAHHAGWRAETSAFNQWLKRPIAKKSINDVTPDDVADAVRAIRSRAKAPPAASTVRNQVSRLSALFRHAAKARSKGGWGLAGVVNPCGDVALPRLPPGRERRLDTRDGGEEARILAALAGGPDGAQMVALVTLAVDTGMRRGEILGLKAASYRETGQAEVHLPRTKNQTARIVVLTDRAAETVRALLPGKGPAGRLFTLTGDQAGHRWDVARDAIGSPDLRLHDLRHEALSRLAGKGLTLGELSSQSGHKTAQTLMRYLNTRPDEVARKLRAA